MMRTINFNLAYAIIFISFCYFIAIGSPSSEAKDISFSKDSKLFPGIIKEESWHSAVKEIFSPKNYLTKYLETTKRECLTEKLPDNEHLPVVTEKETPLAVTDEKILSVPMITKEKGIQKGLVADEDYHSVVPENKVSDENQKVDAHLLSTIPGSETTSAAERQLPDDKEDVIRVHQKTNGLPRPLAGKEEYLSDKLPDNGHQPIVAEKDVPSTATDEKTLPVPTITKEKDIQKGFVADEDYHFVVPENKVSDENQKVDAHLLSTIPGSETTSAAERQLPDIAEGAIRTYKEGNEPLPSLTGKELPSSEAREENGQQEDSLTTKELQQMPTRSEIVQEAGKKENAPIVTTTPEFHNEIIAGGKSLPDEAKDIKSPWDIWHKDPTHNVILAVAITLIAAKIGGYLARMVKFSEVVGNLMIGIILGNIFTFTGWDFFHFLKTMPFLKMISYFGTLILLFTVGLHVDLRALLQVGTSSLLVCLGGIIAPAGLGLMVGHFFLPDASVGTKLILAIILCNTATGLKLAVLKELKAINSLEGRVITGATVLTDIIVFLTFGVVSGFAVSGGVSLVGMTASFGTAIALLILSGILILKYGEKFGNFLTKRMTEGANIPIVVVLSLLLAFMFGSVGLHTIMGAFVAGLFLRNVKLRSSDDEEHRTIESFIRPFYMLLVPILFVRVGAQVDLTSFLNREAIPLIFAITGAAVIGKMFCSVCPIENNINRLAVGLAMVMKMDGTLIVSGIARDMGILNDAVFSSIVVVIVLTSTICPSFLRASLVRQKRRLSKNFHVTVDEKTKETFIRFKSKV